MEIELILYFWELVYLFGNIIIAAVRPCHSVASSIVCYIFLRNFHLKQDSRSYTFWVRSLWDMHETSWTVWSYLSVAQDAFETVPSGGSRFTTTQINIDILRHMEIFGILNLFGYYIPCPAVYTSATDDWGRNPAGNDLQTNPFTRVHSLFLLRTNILEVKAARAWTSALALISSILRCPRSTSKGTRNNISVREVH